MPGTITRTLLAGKSSTSASMFFMSKGSWVFVQTVTSSLSSQLAIAARGSV